MRPSELKHAGLTWGLAANRRQFLLQLAQVGLVGMLLGLLRTVLPTLAETEFGVPRHSYLLLTTFVLAFGLVKALMNFVAGRWADQAGRLRVLRWGWLLALPIPPLLAWAPSWAWVVLATVLLGASQGLTWSMTQVSQLDLTRPRERGLTLGLNEFAGYAGMALAGWGSAVLATELGARPALLGLGLAVVLLALALTQCCLQDTLPWARAAASGQAAPAPTVLPGTRALLLHVSWRDRRLMALCQAGLVEKFVDALVWVFLPLHLHRQGLGLAHIGGIVGAYGLTWGIAQMGTGRLSDRLGRHPLNLAGMLVCAAGVALTALQHTPLGWTLSAALTGLGMALLYPNLAAAVADLAEPAWRSTALGIYRFWRDLGYAVAALLLGLTAHRSASLESVFWFVAAAMVASAGVLGRWGATMRPSNPPR